MGAFGRLADIIRAKVNKLLDRVEDPRDTLDLSYEKQLDNLQKLRRGVAEVATARKRIELQTAALDQQSAKLQEQARLALGQGREDLAREALIRRAAIGEELTELGAQRDQVATQEQKLVDTAKKVQAQVEAFRTKKETLKATYTAAEAQTRIGEAVAGISDAMGDAGSVMTRAQERIADMQARAGAIDELLASGALTDLTTSTDDIQAQLDKVAARTTVDSELALLKLELAGAPHVGVTPTLPAAAVPAPADAAVPIPSTND
jgi:phage shock protein A